MQTQEQRDAYLRDLHIEIHGFPPGPREAQAVSDQRDDSWEAGADLMAAPPLEPDDETAAEVEVEGA